MKNHQITVFTPTFNRADTLVRLYKSLLTQTSKDFYWLIVDDGSTDDTRRLIHSWIKENLVDIEYFYKENGGKTRAHNIAVKNAKSDYFLCVDSDDYLVSSAIEEICSKLQSCDQSCAGIVAYKGISESDRISNSYFPNLDRIKLRDLYNNGFTGDTTLVYRTSILDKYLFPEIPGERFVTENYVYDQIDMKFELLVLPRVMTICEYLSDGYSSNVLKLKRDNPIGWAVYYNQKSLSGSTPFMKFYFAMQSNCYSILGKYKNSISSSSRPLYSIISYIPSLLLVMKRFIQYRNMDKHEKHRN